jgi:iron complex outermembrane recepter protein
LTQYHRKLDVPQISIAPQHKVVTLPTASFTANLSKPVTIYASYTRGLEDSSIAPSSAQNRGEAPPATPTWQVDAGARFIPNSHFQLLAGVFKVQKSYFSLDTAGRYLQLGDISARGIEGSANWSGPEGLTVVAGVCWLRPRVTRYSAEQGASGRIPVGPVPRTININVDYAPKIWKGWATTWQWTSLSSRVETGDDLYSLPPLATLSVTIRYACRLFTRPCSARLTLENATNATGLTISSAYTAAPLARRNYTFTFAADL